jgi:predicted RNA methylase
MLKTQINPANLQEHLESGANALQKGQAQYLTPVAWAQALAKALPNYRPCVTDLTCGSGTLLAGVAGASTDYLLGCDIEDISNLQSPIGNGKLAFVNADVTKFFALLHRVRWQCDLAVLNPPWDIHQYRDRVAMLADSDCHAVRTAFKAHDGRTGKDTIDSTVLTLLMAADRLTTYGEILLIGNQATLDRLILKPGAPHGALREHIWANVTIPGNICDPQRNGDELARQIQAGETVFQTGIIYFARDHYDGFNEEDTLLIHPQATLEQVAESVGAPGFRIARRGARLRPGCANLDSAKLWEAAREEWALQTAATKTINQWNIYLDANGTLRTNLSLFDTASGRVNKQEAERLFNLNGKHPMHLVMARESRRELDRAVNGTRWRVAPAVVEAVTKAIEEYNRQRAPLYPLNKIQRLGYVDENDTLLCVKDLGTVFKAGVSYELKAETVRTTRAGTKMNLEGSLDEVQYDGSELAIWLITPDGEQKLFMDARLMDSSVKLSIQKEGEPSPINFTLHQLVEHFQIPEVPDVATINPEGYQANIALLHEIEQLVA